MTCSSEAYPAELRNAVDCGLVWTGAGDAHALAEQVQHLAERAERLSALGEAAAQTSRQYFSTGIVRDQLAGMLEGVGG